MIAALIVTVACVELLHQWYTHALAAGLPYGKRCRCHRHEIRRLRMRTGGMRNG